MNWQANGNILLGIGAFALGVGLLLRFKAGRWLLAALLVLITLGSLLSGDWHSLADSNPDIGTNPHKASRYWLIGGGICALLGLGFRTLASKSI
ncbi:hypothetical protein [Hymenobacter negativus]|uniref:Uncharacterized protein n=1 Tax=Hymenobacter negativus TaxID=2795026 RepID=A0ABS3QDT8_9BACT|nr:hypothetical protein [Hymenobacter negativus]MBO2009410.1 hypothetical protein [Hymenobacter negativus]